MYNSGTKLYSRDWHNTANQLDFNKKQIQFVKSGLWIQIQILGSWLQILTLPLKLCEQWAGYFTSNVPWFPHQLKSPYHTIPLGFPGGSAVTNPPANARDMGSTPGLGRSPGGGRDNPLQYFCLRNLMGKGSWWATVNGVARGVGRDLATKQQHCPIKRSR